MGFGDPPRTRFRQPRRKKVAARLVALKRVLAEQAHPCFKANGEAESEEQARDVPMLGGCRAKKRLVPLPDRRRLLRFDVRCLRNGCLLQLVAVAEESLPS